MDSSTLALCCACNKSFKKICNQCKNARYCSKSCQKADWPTHKLLCKNFSTFDASSRPSGEHFQAILFSVDREKPEFIWLHCPWKDGDEGKYQHPDLSSIYGPDDFVKDFPVQRNIVLQRNLSDTICIGHRDAFSIDGSVSNKGVQSVLNTKPGQYHDWRGPITIHGKRGLGIDPHACKDIDMNDFRHVTDFFLSYSAEFPATI